MRSICLLLSLVVVVCGAFSQQRTLHVSVIDSVTNESLEGATVRIRGTSTGGFTKSDGVVVFSSVPEGNVVLEVSFVGFVRKEVSIGALDTSIVVLLVPSQTESDEIVVEGTRTGIGISQSPTRVEVLTEEIDEASTMDPSKIAHLLTHSTGIQVQQTSATSNTANVRIQGLDGRYTQILKDGFPLYGGFSGSLSIMQIPPLDLRQVEYIKGGASTLYGGGAVAGLINLLSKDASSEEAIIHINASHIGAFDVNAFVSKNGPTFGFTLLGQRNAHTYFDADDDGYSDMPQIVKYNLNPRLFLYLTDDTKLIVGATLASEERKGGDVTLLNNVASDSVHFYNEQNSSDRITTQVELLHRPVGSWSYALRNSTNTFTRTLKIVPSVAQDLYTFGGKQFSTFSEGSVTYSHSGSIAIGGMNLYTDNFTEDSIQSPLLRDESFTTVGGFINYTFTIGRLASVEAGFRGDYVFGEKFFALPRVSVLFKWTEKLTSRIGGGMGYRNPTIFNQEAELLGYANVLPIDKALVDPEQSIGGQIDLGFKSAIGEDAFININQMFFFTRLQDPLVLRQVQSSPSYQFENARGFTQTYGAETFFKIGVDKFVLFVGYTYTNATNTFDDVQTDLTLTPHHSLKGDLLYSLPGKWRIGVDYEFKSQQTLSNGRLSNAFWTYGAVVEHTINEFTFCGNVENFTDVRQTNYESLVSAPFGTPQFTEVWAPLDGVVVNVGIKIRLK